MTISIQDYDATAPQLFEEARGVLQNLLPEAEIHHVGSTAIPGLGGKGIIDILIAIPDWKDKVEAGKKLMDLGFTHVHKEIAGRIFMSRVGDTVKNDVHIHLTYIGSPDYTNFLSFRDYLRTHPDEASNYLKQKHQWLKSASGHRQFYTASKNDYIAQILSLAKSDLS
ncbi:GrpB family protein [Candidatus Woesebacteria bacterium]|nr:GrpB family protein [Candidatus Woesebacteria bacterium]